MAQGTSQDGELESITTLFSGLRQKEHSRMPTLEVRCHGAPATPNESADQREDRQRRRSPQNTRNSHTGSHSRGADHPGQQKHGFVHASCESQPSAATDTSTPKDIMAAAGETRQESARWPHKPVGTSRRTTTVTQREHSYACPTACAQTVTKAVIKILDK